MLANIASLPSWPTFLTAIVRRTLSAAAKSQPEGAPSQAENGGISRPEIGGEAHLALETKGLAEGRDAGEKGRRDRWQRPEMPERRDLVPSGRVGEHGKKEAMSPVAE